MIEYRDLKEIDACQLEELFLSVGWNSGKFPDKLQQAMRNSHSVCTAWDGEKLVGLMNCISDGVMTAYFHYLLVRPEYQHQGIGSQLVSRMLDRYADYITRVLISYNTQVGFYESCHFKPGIDKTPMFLSQIQL
jgi:GNAT superfamily N-acetyltransferase